ncbi:gp53-like domain-containing protein [Providencia hangzhouensis]|uniref:gp53-like domain-containing protein n=1 Tax=Providencia hangzhouensis TaxID=3031799 RepID=UPI0030D51104
MNNPKLIVVPFAEDGQKDEIPVTREPSMPTQKATWDLGFPPATMLPESAGGLPPRGRDFNGIFNQISEMLVHFAKGGRIKFSESYAEEIGGYQKGAILQSDDETKDYQSLIDGNKVNFNTATSAQINAAWKLISTASLATDISKKLDKEAVKQTTGNSQTSVMSQDAVTKALASKQATGDYATVAQLNNGLSTKQPTGDYLLKSEIPKNTANKQVNGWWKCADTGMIIQWGSGETLNNSASNIEFPIAFSISCFSITGTLSNSTQSDCLVINNINKNSFRAVTIAPGGRWSRLKFSWIALGF